MGCLLASGYASTCQTKKTKNGLQGEVYLFNLKNDSGVKLGFTEDVDGTISDITLATGDQGYKLDGSKLMHTFSTDLSVPTKGNQFYMQNLTVKAIEDTAADLQFIQELVSAEGLVAVIEDYNQNFIILGMQNGLSSSEGTLFTYDTDTAADVGTSVLLSSEGEDAHKTYFFDTDYATTKAKLESYLVPAA